MVLKNIAFFYAISYVIVQETVNLTSETQRIMGGVFITLQLLRYLSCKNTYIFSTQLNHICEETLEFTHNYFPSDVKYYVDDICHHFYICDHWHGAIFFLEAFSLIGFFQSKLHQLLISFVCSG